MLTNILEVTKSGIQDLNLRPHDPQSCALPNCANTRLFKFTTYLRNNSRLGNGWVGMSEPKRSLRRAFVRATKLRQYPHYLSLV